MAAGRVHVFNDPRALRLCREGVRSEDRPVVMVRRLGRSKSTDIDLALGLVPGRTGVLDKSVELKVRWAIVGASQLTHAGSGERVEFGTEEGPRGNSVSIGQIASADVYDAMSERDVAAVIAVMSGAAPDEVERAMDDSKSEIDPARLAAADMDAAVGNSAPPPVGSTDGGGPSDSGSGSLIEARPCDLSGAKARSIG